MKDTFKFLYLTSDLDFSFFFTALSSQIRLDSIGGIFSKDLGLWYTQALVICESSTGRNAF